MKASVIICTRDRCANVLATLQALKSVRIPDGLEAEFLFVDNGSSDATAEELPRALESLPGGRYLREDRRGKSSALNTGLAQSDGGIVILTDDDIRPKGNWIEGLTGEIAQGRADAAAGTVVLAPHLRRRWMGATHKAWLACTESLDPVHPAAAVGANMAFHRRVLEKVPGFDVELGPGKLGLWEDTLFSMQLVEAGFRLCRAQDGVVEHWFDEDRLLREAFLNYARMEARSATYVAWHWSGDLERLGTARLARYRLELAAKRLLRWSEWHQREGAPEWELFLLSTLYQDSAARDVMRQPRRYSRESAAAI